MFSRPPAALRGFRSKLFVPGARAELFDKALNGVADALSFDLEDAVLPESKLSARADVAAALARAAAMPRRPLIIVRVNAPGTPWFEDDLRALIQPGLDWINLPKAESEADVLHAARLLGDLEAAAEHARPIGLLVNIESAAALQRAARIGAAHPRVAGLQLGLADLYEPLGIARHDAANVHATLHALRMAAAAAGVPAYDGAYPDLADLEGFRAEALMARRLGFAGKSCIHPRQIAPANEIFGPSADELAWAGRVDAAASQAETEGRGVVVLDGRMIDAPFVQRARQLLQASRGVNP
ncbi:citrate lyase subunit beta/citryl-CoA lyase [Pelomonas saccharophila]|uniref:Citrate lyase subunit beta/citryl-CoA lyase n=1 Tax=Roseateles saccharophilus TaxID=304 RepID=A0ABU1YVV9_ROSSA|nr:CoA ester lyase [Roseateles saccharophilus]MDR7272988.1 citrate lyase subunit beta/citryl-CoA lyase [Roseateles saccharophilus]